MKWTMSRSPSKSTAEAHVLLVKRREEWVNACIAALIKAGGCTWGEANAEAEAWLTDTLNNDFTESTPKEAADDIMSYWAD